MIRQVFNIDSGAYVSAKPANFTKATGVAGQMNQLRLKSENFKALKWLPSETAQGKPAVTSQTFLDRENADAVASTLSVLGVVKSTKTASVRNYNGGIWTVSLPVADINKDMLQRRALPADASRPCAEAKPSI